jgi:multimeric flavodoxin WrbA
VGKNVLILSSSPRKKGNSSTLCDQFKAGAELAHHHVEKILLADKEVHYCNGCGSCERTGKCAQKDDMGEILDKMQSADVIVMATPVYFYTMCAQMKTVIDRTVARYTGLSGKDFYFIVTAAENDKEALKRTVEGFRGFTSCLSRAKEKGVIYGTGAWKIGDIQSTQAMAQAYEMGKTV